MHPDPWKFDEWVLHFVFKRQQLPSGETFVTNLSLYIHQNHSFEKVRKTAQVYIETSRDQIPHSKRQTIRFYSMPIITENYEQKNLTISVVGQESDIPKEYLKLL